MYFIVKTHSVMCLLLSNDKFYVRFGGSLEYWIWMSATLYESNRTIYWKTLIFSAYVCGLSQGMLLVKIDLTGQSGTYNDW